MTINTSNVSLCTGAGLAALGLLSVAWSLPAAAGCGSPSAMLQSPSGVQGGFVPAVYHPGQDAGMLEPVSTAYIPIVGVWKFEFHLKGDQNGFKDGTLFDWGLATWHSDGTEIQFSAGRPPAAGDVCMGAWKQVSFHRFQLHHIALGLTPPDATGTFQGPAIIEADVTVDSSGETYSGYYSINLYPGSPDNGTEFNESGPHVTFSGTVQAKRFWGP